MCQMNSEDLVETFEHFQKGRCLGLSSALCITSLSWRFEHCGIGRWFQTSGVRSVRRRYWIHACGATHFLSHLLGNSTGHVCCHIWCYPGRDKFICMMPAFSDCTARMMQKRLKWLYAVWNFWREKNLGHVTMHFALFLVSIFASGCLNLLFEIESLFFKLRKPKISRSCQVDCRRPE